MNHQFAAGIQVSTIFSLHAGLFTDTMFASVLLISYCVQTIAIIPVLPRGVLQLGATSVVRYPCFSNWDYYIVSIILHVLKLFCHYYMSHDILLYDCATLLTGQMFCSLDLRIYTILWSGLRRQNLFVDSSGPLKRKTCDNCALFLHLGLL
jgi:hypothetical protein